MKFKDLLNAPMEYATHETERNETFMNFPIQQLKHLHEEHS